MSNPEANAESLRWVVRARWIVLSLAAVLVFCIEWATPGSAYNLTAWAVLLVISALNLGYGLAVHSRRLSRIILPGSFLMDAALISAWVVLSGGAVSFNAVYYLLILIAASMVHSPRMVIGLGLAVIAMFLVAMNVSYGLHIAAQVPAQAMNPFWLLMDTSPEETRRIVYIQQSIRWTVWMVTVTSLSSVLTHRVWQREERIREKERHIDQQRRLLQLGELAGRLAHSLNTPLGLISFNLEVLQKTTKKNTPLYRELEKITGYVQRAANTVEEVLDYNRQNLSQIREVSIPDIVNAVLEAAAARMEKKKGRFILDLQQGIPVFRAYPEAVHQALLNLVENAIDSLPEEGPEGTVAVEARFDLKPVRLSARDQRGDVKIIVRDNGKGVAAKDLKFIFEPFFSTKDFGHGTGLGLPIVRRIMEEHGGQVLAERNTEGGMKFTLLFPAEKTPSPDGGGLPPDFFER